VRACPTERERWACFVSSKAPARSSNRTDDQPHKSTARAGIAQRVISYCFIEMFNGVLNSAVAVFPQPILRKLTILS